MPEDMKAVLFDLYEDETMSATDKTLREITVRRTIMIEQNHLDLLLDLNTKAGTRSKRIAIAS